MGTEGRERKEKVRRRKGDEREVEDEEIRRNGAKRRKRNERQIEG